MSMLDKSEVEYIKYDAEEHAEETTSFGINQAPTLIVKGADGFMKFAGASEIKKYTESVKKAD